MATDRVALVACVMLFGRSAFGDAWALLDRVSGKNLTPSDPGRISFTYDPSGTFTLRLGTDRTWSVDVIPVTGDLDRAILFGSNAEVRVSGSVTLIDEALLVIRLQIDQLSTAVPSRMSAAAIVLFTPSGGQSITSQIAEDKCRCVGGTHGCTPEECDAGMTCATDNKGTCRWIKVLSGMRLIPQP